jgi:hypothetical protein
LALTYLYFQIHIYTDRSQLDVIMNSSNCHSTPREFGFYLQQVIIQFLIIPTAFMIVVQKLEKNSFSNRILQ